MKLYSGSPFVDDIELHQQGVIRIYDVLFDYDVLLDTEAKAASIRKVSLSKFSVLHFQPSLQNLISLLSSDGDMCCNFFVSLDTEASDGVASP